MMQPGSRTFYVYPEVDELEVLVLDWEGVKTSYLSTDDTPFDQRVVKVVSDYAKAHVVREVDKDVKLYGEYYSSYIKERASLFLDEKDMTLFDLPSVTQDHYSRCCIQNPEVAIEQSVSPAMPSRFDISTSPQPRWLGGSYDYVDQVVGPDGIVRERTESRPIPRASSYGLTYSLLPNAPTSLSVPNAEVSEYIGEGLYPVLTISNSDIQIPAQPTNFELFAPPATPQGLASAVGVSTPPSGLEALTKPLAPRGLSYGVLKPPARPFGLKFVGFPPTPPTGLQVPAPRPTGFYAGQESDWPALPTDFDYMIAPSEFNAQLSNASGTVVVPEKPLGLLAVNDGTGGAWIPEAPLFTALQVITAEPLFPSSLAAYVTQFTVHLYDYDGTTKAKTQLSVQSLDGVGVTADPETYELNNLGVTSEDVFELHSPIQLGSGKSTPWLITASGASTKAWRKSETDSSEGPLGTYWDSRQDLEKSGFVFVISEDSPSIEEFISPLPGTTALSHRLKGVVSAPNTHQSAPNPRDTIIAISDLYQGTSSMVLAEDRWYYWIRAHTPNLSNLGPFAGQRLNKYRVIKKHGGVTAWKYFASEGMNTLTVKSTDFSNPLHPGTEVNNYLSNGEIFGSQGDSATALWAGVEYVRIPKADIASCVIREHTDVEYITTNSSEDAEHIEFSFDLGAAAYTLAGSMTSVSRGSSTITDWMNPRSEDKLWVSVGEGKIKIGPTAPQVLVGGSLSRGISTASDMGHLLQTVQVVYEDGGKVNVMLPNASQRGITINTGAGAVFDLKEINESTRKVVEVNITYYKIMK